MWYNLSIWDNLGQKKMKKQTNGIPESNSIRHYIFGLLRTAGNEAVRIPSSYELAERFSVTRRVARYELEHLRDEGYLIAKPRIGMFTNPRLNHISATPIQKSMPLIGIINADGTHFLSGIPEARMMGNFHIALAEAGCMLHLIRFSFHDEEMRIRELKNLGLDGILWRVFNSDDPSPGFLKGVQAAGIPLALVSDRLYPGIPQVILSTKKAEELLFKHLKRPGTVFVVANTGKMPLADALIQQWALPEPSVRRIGKGKVFQETMEEFKAVLQTGTPDLVFCDTLYAEILPDLCDELGLDCEFVTDNEVNHSSTLPLYRGWSTVPDAENAARAAVSLLLAQTGTPVPIENKLKHGDHFL